MIITINEYFESIKQQEAEKPLAQRRSIPPQTEFARAIGVTRQAFNEWIKAPNFREHYLDAIITKMRAYGFETDLGDLVRYVPPDDASPAGEAICQE